MALHPWTPCPLLLPSHPLSAPAGAPRPLHPGLHGSCGDQGKSSPQSPSAATSFAPSTFSLSPSLPPSFSSLVPLNIAPCILQTSPHATPLSSASLLRPLLSSVSNSLVPPMRQSQWLTAALSSRSPGPDGPRLGAHVVLVDVPVQARRRGPFPPPPGHRRCTSSPCSRCARRPPPLHRLP